MTEVSGRARQLCFDIDLLPQHVAMTEDCCGRCEEIQAALDAERTEGLLHAAALLERLRGEAETAYEKGRAEERRECARIARSVVCHLCRTRAEEDFCDAGEDIARKIEARDDKA